MDQNLLQEFIFIGSKIRLLYGIRKFIMVFLTHLNPLQNVKSYFIISLSLSFLCSHLWSIGQ
jgi:hypothetical protein